MRTQEWPAKLQKARMRTPAPGSLCFTQEWLDAKIPACRVVAVTLLRNPPVLRGRRTVTPQCGRLGGRAGKGRFQGPPCWSLSAWQGQLCEVRFAAPCLPLAHFLYSRNPGDPDVGPHPHHLLLYSCSSPSFLFFFCLSLRPWWFLGQLVALAVRSGQPTPTPTPGTVQHVFFMSRRTSRL